MTIKLTREELYLQVWNTPLSTLSNELGISDVGLRKLCIRNNIPTPPQGYHLTTDTTKKAKLKIRLPKTNPNKLYSFKFTQKSQEETSSSSLSTKEQWLIFKENYYEPISKQQLKEINKTLKEIRKPINKRHIDERGILTAPIYHPVRVSPENLEIAFDFLNILLSQLSTLGASASIYNPVDKYHQLSVNWMGVTIDFRVEETSRRVRKPKSEIPKIKPSYFRECDNWNLIPTGKIKLKVYAPGSGYISLSYDKGKIISRIDNLLIKVFESNCKLLERNRIEDIRKSEYLVLLKEQDIQRRKDDFQILKQRELLKEAEQWAKAEQIRAYLKAVKNIGPSSSKNSIGNDEQWEKWLQWSFDYLNNIDPIKQGLAGSIPDYPKAKSLTKNHGVDLK